MQFGNIFLKINAFSVTFASEEEKKVSISIPQVASDKKTKKKRKKNDKTLKGIFHRVFEVHIPTMPIGIFSLCWALTAL